MPDNLARRMADSQIHSATASLARDAERLAATVRRYVDDLARGGDHASGGAYQIAQAAADLLRQASRLDGMRDIADLIPETDPDVSR
jgi:hypothetical protein